MKKLTLLFTLIICLPCLASSFKMLYTFGGGSDGYWPTGLIVGKDGNLYGATMGGGSNNNCGNASGDGTIFKVSRVGVKTILYNFIGGADGCNPENALTMDAAGNFYGTTGNGGDTSCFPPYGCGTIFKITPQGQLTTLYAFEGAPNDVHGISGPLAIDAQGNLYGVGDGGANSCGNDFGCGAVFELSTARVESLVYNFTGSPDGASPSGPIAIVDGILFGTTGSGGDSTCAQGGCGTFYSLNLTTDAESVLYTFEESSGMYPRGLTADSHGDFYGDTFSGGTYGSSRAGVLFKFASEKNGWSESVLYNFGGPNDGWYPNPGLVIDKAGNVYGTCGGSNRNSAEGNVFKITSSGKETILRNFVVNKNGRAPGGAFPIYGPVTFENGVLYGTTFQGGNSQACDGGCGVVFRVER